MNSSYPGCPITPYMVLHIWLKNCSMTHSSQSAKAHTSFPSLRQMHLSNHILGSPPSWALPASLCCTCFDSSITVGGGPKPGSQSRSFSTLSVMCQSVWGLPTYSITLSFILPCFQPFPWRGIVPTVLSSTVGISYLIVVELAQGRPITEVLDSNLPRS